MKITPEMMVEDEKRWHARDVITELSYCGNYMRDRKDMTNLDIRFYAYLMRKAHEWVNVYITREERRRLYNRKDRHGWRCWTSRPTPEQMRETKWEGDSDAE